MRYYTAGDVVPTTLKEMLRKLRGVESIKNASAERAILLGWSRECSGLADLEKAAGVQAVIINHAHVDVRFKATKDTNLRKLQEEMARVPGVFGIKWWEGGAYLHSNLDGLSVDAIYAIAKECNFTATVHNLHETTVTIPLDDDKTQMIAENAPFVAEQLLEVWSREKAWKFKNVLERRKTVLVARIREGKISILSRELLTTSDVEKDAKAAGVTIGEVTKP